LLLLLILLLVIIINSSYSSLGNDLSDLTPEQINILNDWDDKLALKYPVVGKVRLE
jgi:hypothetical protein